MSLQKRAVRDGLGGGEGVFADGHVEREGEGDARHLQRRDEGGMTRRLQFHETYPVPLCSNMAH